MAMEIVTEANPSVQPFVHPFAPDGAKGFTSGWTLEPRCGLIVKTQNSENNETSPAEPENLT